MTPVYALTTWDDVCGLVSDNPDVAAAAWDDAETVQMSWTVTDKIFKLIPEKVVHCASEISQFLNGIGARHHLFFSGVKTVLPFRTIRSANSVDVWFEDETHLMAFALRFYECGALAI